MKLNKLTFKNKRIDIEQGDDCGKYLAFYFYVDGNQLGIEDYNPADYSGILDSNKDLVFIQHCNCGCKDCGHRNIKFLL